MRGKTVLITRSRDQASELRIKIEQMGGSVIEFPVIQTIPPQDKGPLDQVLRELTTFDWILFTSANGVSFFFQRMEELQITLANVQVKIGAVGPKTAQALAKKGVEVAVTAADFKAEGLLAALEGRLCSGDRILLPRANIARETLPVSLKEWGMNVVEVTAYETVPATEGVEKVVHDLKEGSIHFITFTSSSTVQNFVKALSKEALPELLVNVKIVCIGPITAETALKLGLHVSGVAEEYTIDGLVDCLIQLLGGNTNG
jgi:uroporphyrinogen-III synthase